MTGAGRGGPILARCREPAPSRRNTAPRLGGGIAGGSPWPDENSGVRLWYQERDHYAPLKLLLHAESPSLVVSR